MEIRYFDPNEDLSILNNWLVLHKAPEVVLSDLPKLGWVVSDEGTMLCMGFLRLVEGNYAICDSLATNPEISARKRAEAFDKVTERLVKAAKDLKIKHLIAFTTKTGVEKRSARQHGFKKTEQTVLVKEVC